MSKDDDLWVFILSLTIYLISGIAVLVLFIGAGDPVTARRVLKSQDYSDIRIQGSPIVGCGRGDYYKTEFAARSRAGKAVQGIVCCGLFFKGCTIRYD